jgi:4-amino-4-deoxy-L-arabinose transferase-like glycosyltransferase
VAAVTVIGLVLRWIGARESLSGDELFTYWEVSPSSLGQVFDRTEVWENSPPVYLILAWLAGKVGDPATWIRLPSVLAGAAAVPTLYLLGEQISGRRAAVLAAALFAVMPFAVFYGSEGRPYSLLLLLVTLSTLSLIKALGSRRPLPWWVVYWAACVAALYTHYIAGIAIALQAIWALATQVDRRREVFAANAAAFVAFVPWWPQVMDNTNLVRAIEALHPLTLDNVLVDPLRLGFGHPYTGFDQVPGWIGIFLFCVAGTTIAWGYLRPLLAPRATPARLRWRLDGLIDLPRIGLLLALQTAGTLAVILVYSEIAHDSIWEPRDLITVLPYLCLLAGIACAGLPDRFAVVAGGSLVLASLLGSVQMLVSYPRPDLRAAANAIAGRAPQGASVVQPPPAFLSAAPQLEGLAIYVDGRVPISRPRSASEWPRGRPVYAVVTGFQIRPNYERELRQVDSIGRRAGARLLGTTYYDGFPKVTVRRYSAVPPITPSREPNPIGAYIAQHPDEFRKYLDEHPEARKRFNQAVARASGGP